MEKILNICGAKMLALDQLSQVTENQLDLVNNLVIYTCEWTLLLTCIRFGTQCSQTIRQTK